MPKTKSFVQTTGARSQGINVILTCVIFHEIIPRYHRIEAAVLLARRGNRQHRAHRDHRHRQRHR